MKAGVDYLGVTCVFYCHDGKGNLLLQKRSQKCRDEKGEWDCGGGKLEMGESWEEAARREIKEEYGCKPEKLSFVTASNVIRFNQGKKTHWLALLFAVELNRKEVKIADKEKIDEINWFRMGQWPKPLHSMLLKHFNMVKKAI